MIVKANVLGRIEQSFVLFKNNFLNFFIPIFIYNFISFLVFGVIFMSFGLSTIGSMDVKNTDFFVFLNDPKIVILISLGMILLIAYLLLFIPILLSLLKSLKQAINNEEVDIKSNLKYGFLNISNSFKTYWYMFAYVALFPSILFIIGGLLFNVSYFFGGPVILKEIGGFLMILGLIVFFVFSIYRGLKVSFSLASAVNNESYTKDDFLSSVNLTNNSWWRIVGNLLLIGMIVGFTSGFISGIFTAFSHSSIDYSSIKSIDDIKAIASNFSIVTESLSGFVNTIISTIGKILIIIFTYLLYLKLKEEKNSSIIIEESTEKKVEL